MSVVEAFVHEFVWVNDGRPHQSSVIERAINEAVVAMFMFDQAFYEWASISVEKLPCDNRDKEDPESHYPDLCYHFRITIEPEKEAYVRS